MVRHFLITAGTQTFTSFIHNFSAAYNSGPTTAYIQSQQSVTKNSYPMQKLKLETRDLRGH